MNVDKAAAFLFYWKVNASMNSIMPVPEYEFSRVIGRKHRFDWAFPVQKIGIEVDGGQWAAGGGRHAKDRDREKLNIAAALGWRVFRFSPEMLDNDPAHCIKLVMEALK